MPSNGRGGLGFTLFSFIFHDRTAPERLDDGLCTVLVGVEAIIRLAGRSFTSSLRSFTNVVTR